MDEVTFLKNRFILCGKQWYYYDHYWKPTNNIHTLINKYKTDLPLDRLLLRLRDDRFNIKSDPQHFLLFNNGVYDLKLHQFRPSLYHDYITLYTGYDFKSITNPYLDKYLAEVFPYREDYHHFMKLLYLLFKGDKITINAQIKDSNGVTTLYKLIHRVFGTYAFNPPTYVDYKNRKERYIQHSVSTTSVCNSINDHVSVLNCGPFIKGVYELNFRSQFVMSNPYPEKHIYLINKNLTRHFTSFAQALMSKLIHIDQSPTKKLLFMKNKILVQDVNHYILSFYNDILLI